MTKSEEIISSIVQMETRLGPERQELDRLYREFSVAMVPYAAKWIDKFTKSIVEDNAQKINAAGIDTVRSLKAEVASLTNGLGEICAKEFGPSSEWPHNKAPRKIGEAPPMESEAKELAIFRRVISNLGAVLANFGLHDGPTKHWKLVGAGKYQYAFNPGFDAREFPVLAEYEKLKIQHQANMRLLEAARQDLVKAQAQELWDQA